MRQDRHEGDYSEGKFVLYCSPSSIKKKQYSVFALSLLTVAIGLTVISFFSYDWQLNNYLAASLISTPFFLLKSKHSQEMSRVLFISYMNGGFGRNTSEALSSIEFWATIFCASLTTLLVFYIFVEFRLDLFNQVIGYLIACGLAFLTFNTMIVAGFPGFFSSIRRSRLTLFIVILAFCFSIILINTLIGASYVAILTQCVMISSIISLVMIDRRVFTAPTEKTKMLHEGEFQGVASFLALSTKNSITYYMLLPSMVLGLILRCFAIRIVSNTRHICAGRKAFIENWKESVLYSDPLRNPELIPGYEPESSANPRILYRNIVSGRDFFAKKFAEFIILVSLWAGSLAHRITLLSSGWLWVLLLKIHSNEEQSREYVFKYWVDKNKNVRYLYLTVFLLFIIYYSYENFLMLNERKDLMPLHKIIESLLVSVINIPFLITISLASLQITAFRRSRRGLIAIECNEESLASKHHKAVLYMSKAINGIWFFIIVWVVGYILYTHFPDLSNFIFRNMVVFLRENSEFRPIDAISKLIDAGRRLNGRSP